MTDAREAWWRARILALDLEATGTNIEESRIVSITAALVGGGQPTEALSLVVDPGVEIPAEAVAVHGITTERARAEGVPPREALEAVLSRLVDHTGAVVAFVARYDLSIIDRELRRHGVPGADILGSLLVVDPSVLDRHLDRYRRGSRKLAAVCEHYGVRLDTAHDSESDAIAAARLAWVLGKRGEVVRRVRDEEEGRELAALKREWAEVRDELPALHAAQVRWAREQAAGLAEHFARKGQPERVETAWPIVPPPVTADHAG